MHGHGSDHRGDDTGHRDRWDSRVVLNSASNQSDKRETVQSARFGGCAVATERRIEAEFSDGYSGAASGAERNF